MEKYECSYCGVVSSGDKWNEETQKSYSLDIVPIEVGMKKENRDNYGYSCPSCYEYQDTTHMIKE